MTDSPADNKAAQELTRAMRRMLRASRLTRADDAALVQAAAELDAVSAHLESLPQVQRLWITGFDSFEEFSVTTDFRRMFPYSPATGTLNAVAPEVAMEVDGDGVRGTVRFAEVHNGPPFGYVHGGVLATVYDELLAAASMASHEGGFTGRLSVTYRNLTPVCTPIEMRARVVAHEGRKFTVKGEMTLDGTVLSEGEGLFIRPKEVPNGNGWFNEATLPTDAG